MIYCINYELPFELHDSLVHGSFEMWVPYLDKDVVIHLRFGSALILIHFFKKDD